MRRCAPLLAYAIACLGFAAAAGADAIDEEEDPAADACWHMAAGAACELDDKPGVCKTTKCSRRTGGVLNPGVIEQDCLVCDPTAPKKAEAPTKSAAVEDATKISVCSVADDPTSFASCALGLALLLLARKTARRDRPTVRR